MTMMVIRRVLMSIVLIFVSTLTIFVLMSLVPGDAAQTILGENATPQAVEYLRQQLGLDQPLWIQYANWVVGLFRGDLGTSIYSGEPVTKLVWARMGVTFSLMVGSTVAIAVLGIVVGLASALREGWVGRSIDAISLVGFALPSFWIAIVLVAVFAVGLRLFPATGYVPPAAGVGPWLNSLVLPVAALSLSGITVIAKQMRDSARKELERDYVRVLRSTGVSETRIVLLHVLRNASIPTTTLIGLMAVGALSGAVFIENVFVLPGLGSLVTSAATRQDLPVILGVGVAFTAIVILINLVVDVAYVSLNPKVRQSR
ncbi:peptide/nickel transport system permease protein [Microbacterium sp. AG1240]|uniref:ABC transporter permease n=1 Tax=Microbacterium sp. AG1240 TaxID=2183992 RepID=UPI000EB22651|nr:ABC transporter permease [Microbacterium sp. AG1240]RKT31545.1 peptide/nickel transport system permease protein [Microbacterium sp. AG1240]